MTGPGGPASLPASLALLPTPSNCVGTFSEDVMPGTRGATCPGHCVSVLTYYTCHNSNITGPRLTGPAH